MPRRGPAFFLALALLVAAAFGSGWQDNSTGCCIVCNGSCPCGNSCLSCSTRCTQPKGCACGPSAPLAPGEQEGQSLSDGGPPFTPR